MIIAEPTSKPIDRIAIAEERKFGIKASAKAFKLLSSTIYPDPIAAPIRELATNAADSHTEAGTTEPFIVHLPNELEPFFYIRDFGTGMSEESVYKVYCNYFESTRTNSNSFTGAFGLGSKTPFCYSDTFTVISYFDGVKYIYTAFLEDGEPRLAKFAEDQTDEKNGVQVSFPVKSGDIGRFVDTAKNVYSRFVNKPKVIGCNNFLLTNFEYLFTGSDWKMRKDSNKSFLVMGNIGYPLDSYKSGLSYDSELHDLINTGIEITFNIGELQPTVSREEIQYDQETNKKIKEKLQLVKKELSVIAKAQIETATSYYAARLQYTEIFKDGVYNWQLQSILKAVGFEYDGKKITSCNEEIEPIIKRFFIKNNQTYNRYEHADKYLNYMEEVSVRGRLIKKIHSGFAQIFFYSKNTELFINDEPCAEIANKKLKHHLAAAQIQKNVFVFRNVDDDYRKFLFSQLGLDISMFTLVSSLSLPPKVVKVKNIAPRVSRPKNIRNLKKLNINSSNRIFTSTEDVDINNGEYFYVNMTFNEIVHKNESMGIHNLSDYFTEYKSITGDDLKLYALTPSKNMKKIPANWHDFFDSFYKLMQKKINDLKFVDHTKIEEDHEKINPILVATMKVVDASDFNEGKLKSFFINYKNSLDIREKNTNKLTKIPSRFRHMIKLDEKKSTYECVSDAAQKIIQEYPIFEILMTPDNAYWHIRDTVTEPRYKKIIKSFVKSVA
jgi:hypothetical protein